jgi:putative DNA methylase
VGATSARRVPRCSLRVSVARPADEHCPQGFREVAAKTLSDFAEKVRAEKQVMELCAKHWTRWKSTNPRWLRTDDPTGRLELRGALLDFIADFANWDASTVPAFLDVARDLTAASHHAMGAHDRPAPVVIDPFCGGGSIPLESLRIGAQAVASDLNPLPVLLNKVIVEYGPAAAEEVIRCFKESSKKVAALAQESLVGAFSTASGNVPIAYLWGRTVRCHGPSCGATIPLVRTLRLSQRGARSAWLKLERKNGTEISTQVVFQEAATGKGTIARGAVTCPLCAYTTASEAVRAQLAERHGGSADAQLLAVIERRPGGEALYRGPDKLDYQSVTRATALLMAIPRNEGTLSTLPDERIPEERPSPNARGLSAVTRIGMTRFSDLYTPRQQLVLALYCNAVRDVLGQLDRAGSVAKPIVEAVGILLAAIVGKRADFGNTLCSWRTARTCASHAFTRQALPITWDFAEMNPFAGSAGDWNEACAYVEGFLLHIQSSGILPGTVRQCSATELPWPNESCDAMVTDPPYYDSVPYADLSDFFYVWIRRCLFGRDATVEAELTPKDAEAIWNPSRRVSDTGEPKDQQFYEKQMGRAFAEGRRVVRRDGVGVVVFAHKSTEGWEAVLEALLASGWTATASWPIDTEREGRMNSMGTASLASSVHIVCRPRDARIEAGDWRSVLAELPRRLHDWMPRLAEEGIVGADAIFACIGPALEIFSRYPRVEKASGEAVKLKEYLEQVWAAVAQEALSLIFEGADASGLEEDARLTAMWLWTLGAGTSGSSGTARGDADVEDDGDTDEEEDGGTKGKMTSGFVLEFDAARKIAQGLGAHLEKLMDVVEVKGDKARLLAVAERAKSLFSKDTASVEAPFTKSATTKAKTSKKQLGLFAEIEAAEKEGHLGKGGVPKIGETTLDRVHQSMILFGAGRSEALKRFVVEQGVGNDGRFWRLSQCLSALYPSGSDEKRWVDGVLARKKSLGF